MKAKCLICGRELEDNVAQIIVTKGIHKFKSICLCHEGSEELKKILEEK